jgi:chromosomal replication initiation ATPase DnaA
MQQLTLTLPAEQQEYSPTDFMITDANESAYHAVSAWPKWAEAGPWQRMLIIYGPEGCGKTHLAHMWAKKSRAEWLMQGMHYDVIADEKRYIVDDARRWDPRALLHILNYAQGKQAWILMTMEGEPASWHIPLADLRSRLRAIQTVGIAAPDDMLLTVILGKLLADRQLRVPEDVLHYCLKRMERSYIGAWHLVQWLDQAALKTKQPINLHLARQYFAIQEQGTHSLILA